MNAGVVAPCEPLSKSGWWLPNVNTVTTLTNNREVRYGDLSP